MKNIERNLSVSLRWAFASETQFPIINQNVDVENLAEMFSCLRPEVVKFYHSSRSVREDCATVEVKTSNNEYET